MLTEAEDLRLYVKENDVFFYTLVYDPNQKTLLADKGEIRIGPKYQCTSIPDLLEDPERYVQSFKFSRIYKKTLALLVPYGTTKKLFFFSKRANIYVSGDLLTKNQIFGAP